jgi:hypothetical protein
VTRRGGSALVRIANATGVQVAVPTGIGRPRELAAILHALGGVPSGDVFAHIDGPAGSRSVRIEAPLRVRGEIVSGARRVPVDVLLGGSGRSAVTVRVPGPASPRLRLTATPFLPQRLLHLRPGLDGAGALDYTVETLSRAARVEQYRRFLANPDPRGRSTAVYEFRTTRARAALAPGPRADEGGGGHGALGIALWLAGAATALVGGAVLWARS